MITNCCSIASRYFHRNLIEVSVLKNRGGTITGWEMADLPAQQNSRVTLFGEAEKKALPVGLVKNVGQSSVLKQDNNVQ
jgi:hypothetical protein